MGASWIKLSTSLFYDQKVQLIMAREDGNSIILVWIRLMMLAGETNDNGYVYITENLPLTAEDLSILMRMSVAQIHEALAVLEKYGMIEICSDGKIFISNWSKHQNTAALERIKTKERVRKYREKQQNKQTCNVDVTENVTPNVTPRNGECNAHVTEDVTQCNDSCNEYCNADVTPKNKNIDIENKNKDIEIEREKEKNILPIGVGVRQPQGEPPPSSPSSPSSTYLAPLHDEIAAEYEKRFTDMLPASAWGSISKERSALIKLSRNTKYLSRDLQMNPLEMIPLIIDKYLELKRFGKTEFWRDAPLTPSQLLARWDQVIGAMTKEPMKEEVLF